MCKTIWVKEWSLKRQFIDTTNKPKKRTEIGLLADLTKISNITFPVKDNINVNNNENKNFNIINIKEDKKIIN